MSLKKVYFFIDESGDPSFFGKKKKLLIGNEGFQPLLILGALEIENKKEIRKQVIDFQENIKNDILFNSIPSIKENSKWYLHAKNDFPDIRTKFFELIRNMEGVKCMIVIGRKRLDVFRDKHNGLESEFYFDMVYHLLKEKINNPNRIYNLFLADRNTNSVTRFKSVVEKVINQTKSDAKIDYKCNIVSSTDTPELSIIDYLLWALQRYIYKGEARYYLALQSKFEFIIDLYDFEKKQENGKTIYTYPDNPFLKEKASEFRKDGYL
jgi:Protein of unknown function (DUF3800)